MNYRETLSMPQVCRAACDGVPTIPRPHWHGDNGEIATLGTERCAVLCDRCRKRVEVPLVPALPPGWQTREYCPDCAEVVDVAKERDALAGMLRRIASAAPTEEYAYLALRELQWMAARAIGMDVDKIGTNGK